MTEQSMVDRVAQAIWEGERYSNERLSWDELPNYQQELGDVQGDVRAQARAAIAAMRTATEQMHYEMSECYFADQDIDDIWVAGIDAALKED